MYEQYFEEHRAGFEPISLEVAHEQQRAAVLRSHIAQAGGALTVAEYMDFCLYEKEGYYNSGLVSIGQNTETDFITAPETHPVFSQILADTVADLWHDMGKPEKFQLVEMGAGNGCMAADMLNWFNAQHGELYDRVQYIILEQSPVLLNKQRKALTGHDNVAFVGGSATEVPLRNIKGIVISNELPDTFPVHLVTLNDEGTRELYVAKDGKGGFTEEEGPLSAEAAHYLGENSLVKNQISIVNPSLYNWQTQVSRALQEGYVITIDYPFSVGVPPRPRAYSRSLPAGIPYTQAFDKTGQVDVTCSVDFHQLQQAGRAAGLSTESEVSQADFLLAKDFAGKLEDYNLRAATRGVDLGSLHVQTLMAQRLINQDDMGGHRVLLQRKES